ncbi:hypothetical protein NDU88_007345 [Pleurodeles waltl]|uniref:Uncharacterized protein n=1 Tax=Pleurodeles waltl TaxID=8319 RepID=A0AAV7VS99_PLEWA|nr:hypothetical protein NDU88_007345 [Pleurodeles waltl]
MCVKSSGGTSPCGRALSPCQQDIYKLSVTCEGRTRRACLVSLETDDQLGVRDACRLGTFSTRYYLQRVSCGDTHT